ncbi:MAG: DNA polymerase III subunit gamma/tau [Betaproteobacteria bacterium]
MTDPLAFDLAPAAAPAPGQALARKWRPRNFDQLVGQEHVVRALTNALRQNRLHHAYLLTGTRGVGKTTLARVLAKALNCETGITAAPCGVCSACLEIDSGRFVDLLELDAASHTQVDNMRELLENALYAPTSGRFKIYIIDEVHMLSRSAFNAMLKTLEEPPAHVKFILATTDPQKVPVTVLSRCLQFNLKQIPAPQIRERLEHILQQEKVSFEIPALNLIGRAAQGSLRDALSLLDQAIAHGAGQVEEASVRAMLGTVDQSFLFALLDALSRRDGAALLSMANEMQARSISFDTALQELATLLHRVALAQTLPDAIAADDPDRDAIFQLAAALAPEDIQLYYQIALQGRADLPLAPDEFAGFTMPLLRMLAFAPSDSDTTPPAKRETTPQAIAPARTPAASAAGASAAVKVQPVSSVSAPRVIANAPLEMADSKVESPPKPQPAPAVSITQKEPPAVASVVSASVASPELVKQIDGPIKDGSINQIDGPIKDRSINYIDGSIKPIEGPIRQIDNWHVLVPALKVGGMARMLAQHSELTSQAGERLFLMVPEAHRHLLEKPYRDKLQAALEEHFGRRLRLEFTLGQATGNTPAERDDQERQARQRIAIEAIDRDPFVRELVENFDARVIDESVRPIEETRTGEASR